MLAAINQERKNFFFKKKTNLKLIICLNEIGENDLIDDDIYSILIESRIINGAVETS